MPFWLFFALFGVRIILSIYKICTIIIYFIFRTQNWRIQVEWGILWNLSCGLCHSTKFSRLPCQTSTLSLVFHRCSILHWYWWFQLAFFLGVSLISLSLKKQKNILAKIQIIEVELRGVFNNSFFSPKLVPDIKSAKFENFKTKTDIRLKTRLSC